MVFLKLRSLFVESSKSCETSTQICFCAAHSEERDKQNWLQFPLAEWTAKCVMLGINIAVHTNRMREMLCRHVYQSTSKIHFKRLAGFTNCNYINLRYYIFIFILFASFYKRYYKLKKKEQYLRILLNSYWFKGRISLLYIFQL